MFRECHLTVASLVRFSISSWAIFVATWFGKSPQLSAICTTAIGFVSAILAMAFGHSPFFAWIFTFFLPPSFLVFALRALAQEERYQKELADAAVNGYTSYSWQDFDYPEFSLGDTMLFAIVSLIVVAMSSPLDDGSFALLDLDIPLSVPSPLARTSFL